MIQIKWMFLFSVGGPGVNEFKKGGKKKDNVITADTKTLSPTHINTGKTVVLFSFFLRIHIDPNMSGIIYILYFSKKKCF